MYYFPYSDPCTYCMMRQIGTGSTYVRLLHASPDAKAVDVYVDGNLIAGRLRYRRFTPYVKIVQGPHNVKTYLAGTTTKPILTSDISLNPNSIYTLAVIGRTPALEVFVIPEPRVAISGNRANIRFVHLSPGTQAVDVTLSDGKVLFPNVSYKGITNYIQIPPSRYTLQARLSGTDRVALTVPNVIIKPGKNYTLYAVGLADGKPSLQLLIPLDGSTYL